MVRSINGVVIYLSSTVCLLAVMSTPVWQWFRASMLDYCKALLSWRGFVNYKQ